MSERRDRPSLFGRRAAFPATRWTVLGETEPGAALQAELYAQYWDPLYCYARRRGFAKEDANDFTQGFLTEILLGREFLSKADRARGRFRSLLVKAFQNYIGSILRKKKVPIGAEADIAECQVPDTVSHDPGAAFDYVWAVTVLDRVLAELDFECQRDGLGPHGRIFEEKVTRPILDGTPAPSLKTICQKYALRSQGQASNMIVTVKRRFRRILLRHVAEPDSSEAEAEEALGEFLSIFSRS